MLREQLIDFICLLTGWWPADHGLHVVLQCCVEPVGHILAQALPICTWLGACTVLDIEASGSRARHAATGTR